MNDMKLYKIVFSYEAKVCFDSFFEENENVLYRHKNDAAQAILEHIRASFEENEDLWMDVANDRETGLKWWYNNHFTLEVMTVI